MLRQQKKEIVVPVQNRFAAFDTDSDSDEEDVIVQEEKKEEETVKVKEEQRVWPTVKEEVDPVSLFTSQRKTRRSGVQKEDSEGWVSITRTSKPVKEEDEEKEIQKEVLEEIQEVEVKPIEAVEVEKANFVPLLARGGGASVWATRIRESLEKAEKATPPNPNVATDQFIGGLGRVSFFSN